MTTTTGDLPVIRPAGKHRRRPNQGWLRRLIENVWAVITGGAR